MAAVVALLAGTCIALASASPAAADLPITTGCPASTTVGTTITLTADCVTTQALTVPDGFTLNGGGFTIAANNPPAPAHTYTGAVVTNAPGATSMNIENLTITGPAAGFPFTLPAPSCNTPFPGLFGVFFNDAGGSVNNVKVLNIFQTNTAPGSPACNTGHSIRADGVTAPRTVTITNTQVSNYQKAGMFASGMMTMNVSASTIGPPSFVPFSIGQNGVQWTNTSTNSNPAVGASGTMTGSTIIGSSFVSTGPVDPTTSSSTAVLLFGSNNVTVDHNTITGGSDFGISVVAASTNTTISFNAINRPDPPTPDSFGIGVDVDADSAATTRLICNTFSGWQSNLGETTPAQEACADLVMGKTASTSTAIPGEPVTYTLTARNDGPDPAVGVVVSDTLPAGVTVVSAPGCTTNGSTLTCAVGPLAVGASTSFTVVVTVASTTPPGTALVNTTQVSGDVHELDPTDNTASVTTTVTEVVPPTARDTARFVALTPARILDTRTQNAQVGYTGPKPGPGDTVEFQVTGRGGVPTGDVTAVVMTVTATEPTGEGFITVWPTGEARPFVSSLNSRPEPSAPSGEQAVPNLVTVPVGVNGRVSIYTQAGTDLLADVAGYYQSVSQSAEGRLVPIGDPVRVLDTRPESGPLGYSGDKPVADQTVTFQVAGLAGVPARGASAVVLNVTATEATDRGFVTAFPGGQPLPWASNLNLEYVGQTVADQVVVPLGPDGDVSVYTQRGTHLVADVAGWFTGPTAPETTSGLFRAISPERHLDTRLSGGPVPPGGTVVVATTSTVAPSGPSLIPATGVGAVIANVTGTEATDKGFVTAYPDGSYLPWASNLNLERAGQTLPNHVTVGVGPSGAFTLYTQSGAHLVADLFGWYLA